MHLAKLQNLTQQQPNDDDDDDDDSSLHQPLSVRTLECKDNLNVQDDAIGNQSLHSDCSGPSEQGQLRNVKTAFLVTEAVVIERVYQAKTNIASVNVLDQGFTAAL